MIRYLIPATIPILTALNDPRVARLRGAAAGAGWRVSHADGHTVYERISDPRPTAWTAPRPGIDGLLVQVADPLPPFDLAKHLRKDLREDELVWVDLACGVRVPVRPACYDGDLIGWDLAPTGPASDYARAVERLDARLRGLPEDGPGLPWTDPDVVAVCRQAVMSATTLTVEEVHAYGLISTRDVEALFAAASSFPKA